MYKLMLTAVLSTSCNVPQDCPKMPELVNETEYKWNKTDFDNMHRAQFTCGFRYRNCLVRFTKIDKQDYFAVCGDAE